MAGLLSSLGPLGPMILLGVLGAVLILGALVLMFQTPQDPYDRLKERAATQSKGGKERLRHDTGTDKLDKYAQFLEPQDEEEFSAMRLKMIQAGYRTKNAVRTFHFCQFALGLGFLAAGVILVLVQSAGADSAPGVQQIFLTALLPGVVGYMLPKYWVNKRVGERQGEITSGFPDSLDLMLVCVEAGQSLDQSIVRVADEMKSSFPALAEEFLMVAHEMKAGKDKASVLRDMAERCGVPDVASFVTVLIQSQQFGTSIAEALRVYAGEMRDKRVMRAEEKANTLPTKMTLATMMLTVPPLLLIMIGPSIFEIYNTLSGGAR